VRVRRRPLFVDDLTRVYAYLADRSPRSADRFLEEVELVVDLLAEFPELGRPRDELKAGLHSFRVRRFRHLIFYRVTPNTLVLLRVLHGARDLERQQIE